MNLIAAIWSADDIDANYVRLEATDQLDRNGNIIMKFVMEVKEEKSTLDKWVSDYYAQRQKIEPLSYEFKLNLLRDNLKNNKPRVN
tara:strand:- start:32040 stop:32297 length:258 start_codon:yes stop_codon:yes gene_type:complete